MIVEGTEVGTSQFLSVSNALYAAKAGNGFSGNYNDPSNLPTLPNSLAQLTPNAGSRTITNVAAPAASTNAATKGYVDAILGQLSQKGVIVVDVDGSPNSGATNEIRFTGIAAGARSFNGSFSNANLYGYFWATTIYDPNKTFSRALYYSDQRVTRYYYNKGFGLSVRCVKD